MEKLFKILYYLLYLNSTSRNLNQLVKQYMLFVINSLTLKFDSYDHKQCFF